MTPEEQEKRAAELHAEGKTEREIAAELGISPATAHRRLQAAQDAETDEELTARLAGTVIPMRVMPDGRVVVMDPAEGLADEVEDAMRGEVLEQLRKVADEAAAVVADIEARAQASRDAIAALDAERLQLLAEGKDASGLRDRRANAVADLADAEQAAQFARGRFEEAAARVLAAEAEIAAAAAEKRRQEAVQLGRRLAPRAAAALREAVIGTIAVQELAEAGSELARIEAVADRSWDEEIIPPALPGHPGDQWHRAVWDLWRAARSGDVAACQRAIPACLPWQDRDPQEIEQMRAAVVANADRLNRLAMENMMRGRAAISPAIVPQLPNPTPGSIQTARTGW